ncbi:TetR/AcrR family transcriptional regulator [Microbacterium sp. ASV49]|uniref:TetR/AcrR family transcriptional regulator n=1 Tax=Microbacterium candidum TaxID=3041922 RepID=A0ABT7N175_9MICO|nr:TetR/AcrR family transcriptional regulator [Microbacterium sp. ASV49]MDL9980459.1 TetR/AcrR family transcriptional regulator [Microbacterium sp. ASV49]
MPQPAVARATYHHGNLREALIDAGLALTRAGGASALVLRDVARVAGVSPSATYRHFADRESLLVAVATRIQEHMAERMVAERTDAALPPARDRLRAVGLGYIGFALAEPGWFDVAFSEIPVRGDGELPAPLASLVEALDGLVADGALAASARAGAEWPCWSAVHGFALLALRGPLRGTPSTAVRAAAERTVDAIIGGLLAG